MCRLIYNTRGSYQPYHISPGGRRVSVPRDHTGEDGFREGPSHTQGCRPDGLGATHRGQAQRALGAALLPHPRRDRRPRRLRAAPPPRPTRLVRGHDHLLRHPRHQQHLPPHHVRHAHAVSGGAVPRRSRRHPLRTVRPRVHQNRRPPLPLHHPVRVPQLARKDNHERVLRHQGLPPSRHRDRRCHRLPIRAATELRGHHRDLNRVIRRRRRGGFINHVGIEKSGTGPDGDNLILAPARYDGLVNLRRRVLLRVRRRTVRVLRVPQRDVATRRVPEDSSPHDTVALRAVLRNSRGDVQAVRG